MSARTGVVLAEHLGYLSERRRLKLFQQAISQAVRSGDRVLDLGCGTGVLGLMALKAGAAHVDAIDSSDALEIARCAFEKAGFSANCSLYAESTFNVSVTEFADVAVCDHIGYFGFDYGLIGMLADARARLLKPEALLVPCSLDLWLAPVSNQSVCADIGAWGEIDFAELRWVQTLATNTKHAVQIKADDLGAAPALVGSLDLTQEIGPALCLHAEFTITHDCVLYGLAGWFDAELARGIRMNNSPLSNDQTIARSQAYLPFSKPLSVKVGQTLLADVVARPEEDHLAWTVSLPAQGVCLRQSTLEAELVNPQGLPRGNQASLPVLNRRGQAKCAVLSWCDGKHDRALMQDKLRRDFADVFPTDESARRFVAATIDGYLQC